MTSSRDTGSQQTFSFICLNEEKRFIGIKEKNHVLENADTNAFGFAVVAKPQNYLSKLFETHCPKKGELYTSSALETVVKDGLEFSGIEAEEFACDRNLEQALSFGDVLKRNKQFVNAKPLVFSVSQSSESRESVSNGPLKPADLSEDHD